ncbi:CoA-transferase family III domain-containing protein [Xylaria castorea]|nr:CoA-transferase family III domain-containing protein [Xylaria castorea]
MDQLTSGEGETKKIVDTIRQYFIYARKSCPADEATLEHLGEVFEVSRDHPYFPIPFKETEIVSALKMIEGSLAKTILSQRMEDGISIQDSRVTVNLDRTTAFLFQTYVTTLNGCGKLAPWTKWLMSQKQFNTDIHKAQSIPFHRMSANIFKTAGNDFYHFHGSLNPKKTLTMLGLHQLEDEQKPEDHEEIVNTFEQKTVQRTSSDWDAENVAMDQAGVRVLTHDEFMDTDHGKALANTLPWTVEQVKNTSTMTNKLPVITGKNPRPLQGVKVIEFCRIIAGPTIGRILAEYGAEVIKITSPAMPDVSFFQTDVNMGKRCISLDLKNNEEDKATFRAMIKSTDIILDGYRPGAIAKLIAVSILGLKPQQGQQNWLEPMLHKLTQENERGYVYVAENCFGHVGPWKDRKGWQQIADCVSGLAWAQGRFMGSAVPVVPPFPISDYGTGCMGAIAAMVGLLNRAKLGGSWIGKTSLVQYNLLLFKQGQYDHVVQEALRRKFLELTYHNNVDQVSGAALRSMLIRHRHLFIDTNNDIYEYWLARKYRTETCIGNSGPLVLRAVKPVVSLGAGYVQHRRPSRPNAADNTEFNKEDPWEISTNEEGPILLEETGLVPLEYFNWN